MAESTSVSQQAKEPERFTNIPLGKGDSPGQPKQKKKKEPKRILHFSDGILEEYSTDEEDETDNKPSEPPVDPKKLTWLPWFWYYLVAMSSRTLSVADACGEKLAWFFGITAPKYQYAIDEYYRLKEEEEKDKERYDQQTAEMSTIKIEVVDHSSPVTPQPESPLKY